MCLYPTLMKNRRYVKNQKNGGVIPPISDERLLWVATGCGECMECRKQRARAWQLRLLEDIKKHKNGKFVTLTFSNEAFKKLMDEGEYHGIEGYRVDNQVAIRAVELFRERWRKLFGVSIRHWLVTELGHEGTENIHLHGIVWVDDWLKVKRRVPGVKKKVESMEFWTSVLAERWGFGYVWTGYEHLDNYVNNRTVNYIIKYVHKMDKDHPGFKGRVLTSQGIGKSYIESVDRERNVFRGKDTKTTYKNEQGYEMAMPIYWRNKLYSEKQREELWLALLDKGERWVCGEKVRASDEKDYYGALKHYRALNRRLGYGSDEKDWDRIQYEERRRAILRDKRVKEAKVV